MNRRLTLAALTFAALLTVPTVSSAANLVKDALLGDIFKDIDNSLSSIMADAQTNLNVGEGNAAQVVMGVLKQAESDLNDFRDKTFGDLDNERQAMLKDLNASVDDLSNKIADRQYEADVELNRLLHSIKFWQAKMPFMIAGIKGLSQIKHLGAVEYTMVIYGNGMGTDEGDVKYDPRIDIGTVQYGASGLDKMPTGYVIHIKPQDIDPLFKNDSPTRVPVKIHQIVERPCVPSLGFLKCHDKYQTDFTMTLYPVMSVSAVVESVKNVNTPGTEHVLSQTAISTPDKHNNGNAYVRSATYVVPPNYLLLSASVTGCRRSTPSNGHDRNGECDFNFGEACHVDKNAGTAFCDATVGSHPHWLDWSVTVADKVPVGQPLDNTNISFPTDADVKVSYQAAADGADIRGKTWNGEDVYVTLKPLGARTTGAQILCQPSQLVGINVTQYCRALPLRAGAM